MQNVSEYHRYCPDQPKVLISDAVCRGRRRTRYPQCPNCPFNDDEQGPALAASKAQEHAARKLSALETVFTEQDVRATYPDPLDEEIAWRIGHAAASYFRGALRGLDRSDPVATTIAVGRDMRRSSASLAAAFIEGARSTGADVVDLGLIDTPQLFFAIQHLRCGGGVQTTGGSHPPDQNGFKFAGQGGRSVGADTGLLDMSRIAQNMVKHDTGQQGALRTVDLSKQYRAFVRNYLAPPRPMKVVVDASNGMAGKWMPIVFDGVEGIEFTYLNMEHEGDFAHDPDPLAEPNLQQLRDEVLARGADLGVCFNGDAERVVLVDERAGVVRSDILAALLARPLLAQSPGSTVVYDLRGSRVVAEQIKAAGGVPRRERAGAAFIKKALTESKGIFAGDVLGRYYFKESGFCESSLLALVHAVNLLTSEASPLSALVAPLVRYAMSGQRRFEHAEAEAVIRRLADAHQDARVDFLDGVTVQYEDWWFNVRLGRGKSRLLLNLEAATPELMQQKLDEVAAELGTPL